MIRRSLLLAVLAFAAGAARAADVTICADPDPPPSVYWVRDANDKPTGELAGYTIDLLNLVFSRLHLTVRFIGTLPWARCMLAARNGEVDFAAGAYYSEERARVFSYSTHYRTRTPQVYYLKSRPLDIKSTADLKRYHGCGLMGASYEHYGLSSSDLDIGVNTYDGLINKLKAHRCDYFVEELDVIGGFKLLGPKAARDYLADPEIAHAGVPGATAPSAHLITVKGSRYETLLPQIDEQILLAIRSGEAERLWRRHAQDLVFRP